MGSELNIPVLEADEAVSRIIKLPKSKNTQLLVNVENSQGVHVGNIAHLHGPIVIKQYLSKDTQGSDDLDDSDENVLNYLEAMKIKNNDDSHGRKLNFPPYDFLARDELRLITRTEWLARPSGVVDSLDTPVPHIILAHTGTEFCTDQLSCIYHMRYLQNIHIDSRRWSDIGYNFVVGGDGSVYEGRGWDTVGAHTRGNNKTSIGIALIGKFEDVLPPDNQLQATKKIIELCVSKGKLIKDYKLFGARQLIPSESPGKALFSEMKKWAHFCDQP